MKPQATPPRPVQQPVPPEAEMAQPGAIPTLPSPPEALPQVGHDATVEEWLALKKRKSQAEDDEALTTLLNSEWPMGAGFQAPADVDAPLMAQASSAPSAAGAMESTSTTASTAAGAEAASSTAALAAAPSFAPWLALGALGMGGGGGGGGGGTLSNAYEPMSSPLVVSLSDIQVVGGPARDTLKLEPTELSDGDDERPRVIGLGNGGMAVAWYGADLDNTDYSIFVQVIQANGQPQGNPVKLEGLGVTNGHDFAPELAALGTNGEFVVTWYGTDTTGDNSVFVQRFDAQGQPNGQMVQLEALNRTDGQDVYPQVAALGDAGRFVVTWSGDDVHEAGQTTDDKSIFVQIFDDAGQPSGALVQLEPTGVTRRLDSSPQVKALGTDGRFVVTWAGMDSQGDQSIFVQSFDAAGQPSGDMVLLEGLDLTTGADYEPQVAVLDTSGRFVVTWHGRDKDGDASVYVSAFGANGQPTGNPVRFGPLGIEYVTESQQMPTALGHEGRFVVTWYGKDSDGDFSIFVQAFDATGQPSAEWVQLEPLGVNKGMDFSPKVTALDSSGRFVVAWYGQNGDSDDNIFVQLFGADGQTHGAIQQLEAPDRTGGSDEFPQLTALGNGGFAVVWSGQDSGGDTSIYVQRFDAEGQPVQQAYGAGEVVTLTYDPSTNTDVASVVADFSALGGPAAVAAAFHTEGDHAGLWVATYTVPDNHLPHANAQIRLTVTDTGGNATTVTDGALLSLTASAIDLGEYGQLLAPVQAGDQWYYWWDRNGDGQINTDTLAGSGRYSTDLGTVDELQALFGTEQTWVVAGVEMRLPTLTDDQFVKVQVSAVL